MKKFLCLFLSLILAAGCLSACQSSSSTNKQASEDSTTQGKKISVVTTIFPEYDWVSSILGDNPGQVDLTMLLDQGVDLHSYQPSADDMVTISNCDLFIYVGGESDEWVEDALKGSANSDRMVINLLDMLGDQAKEEEIVEGMEEEEHEGEEEEGHEGEKEYDEHVWLSLKNACSVVENISTALQDLDPDHAEIYKTNTETYLEDLRALDEKYQAACQEGKRKVLLFGDRFPFRYMVNDYGLSYYAAFVGCSAETEASFETITFLAGKVDEYSLPLVLTIDGSDQKIAETIIQNTREKNQKILTMDSMQSTTSQDVENGVTYLSVMEKNLNVLKEALR